MVALRKESVDRNTYEEVETHEEQVALRKESVDRNLLCGPLSMRTSLSLSARRAWIEIDFTGSDWVSEFVALRKESVDRN